MTAVSYDQFLRDKVNPVFVEWMMGLPAGWVTDLMRPADSRLKLSRNQALRILGNGVVPQQAEAALRFLEAL